MTALAGEREADVSDAMIDAAKPKHSPLPAALPVEVLAPSDEQIMEATAHARRNYDLMTEPTAFITAVVRAAWRLAPPAVLVEPAGWQLVPNTATHNMLNAANAGRKKGHSSSGAIYSAMLAAAPSGQPAPEGRSDYLFDSHYIAGAKQGFTLGQSDDSAGLQRLIEARRRI